MPKDTSTGDAPDTALADAIERKAAELQPGVHLSPQQIANHFREVVFTGGPPAMFERVGRESFVALLRNGMYPHSTCLDIGCGNLRLGYWLINFLQPGGYFGIDPERTRVEFGVRHVIGEEVADAKRPSFDHNGDFDLTVFGRRFDFAVARSIWTHTSKAQIRAMLDGFAECAADEGVFLASYVPAKEGDGFAGDDWVTLPLVEHGLDWVGRECASRGLAVRQLPDVINDQPWLRIERARGPLQPGLHQPPPATGGLASRVRTAARALLGR